MCRLSCSLVKGGAGYVEELTKPATKSPCPTGEDMRGPIAVLDGGDPRLEGSALVESDPSVAGPRPARKGARSASGDVVGEDAALQAGVPGIHVSSTSTPRRRIWIVMAIALNGRPGDRGWFPRRGGCRSRWRRW